MLIETFKEFTFEAAHSLPPYAGLHGHTFRAAVYITGVPDPEFGWVCNQYELEMHIESIRRALDHKYLNDIEGLSVPSLENVARWIWNHLSDRVRGLDRVIVQRGTDGQAEGCTYRGSPGFSHGQDRAGSRLSAVDLPSR